jgi:ABC-type antimicrobial peptide transport system ATPase subunit
MSDPLLLEIKDLSKSFALGGGLLAKPHAWIRAVDAVSFSVARGESFGLGMRQNNSGPSYIALNSAQFRSNSF